MAWSTQFESMMSTGVTRKSVSGLSTDGYLTHAAYTSSTHIAHHSGKQTNVRTFAGEEEVATGIFWCKSTSTFAPSDRLVWNASTFDLLKAEAYYDEDGLHHVKCFVS